MAARLPYLDRTQVDDRTRTVFDTLEAASGRVLNIFRLMAHHARSLAPFLDWYPRLREGPLDLKLRYSRTSGPRSSIAAATASPTTARRAARPVSRRRSSTPSPNPP